MDESKDVGPERTLHVDKIVDEDRRVVEYRLAVYHKIAFPFDDSRAWDIPEEYVAAMLSDGLREFVNNCQHTDVIRKCASKCVVRLKESRAIPRKEPRIRWYFDEDGNMRKYDEDEED